MFATIQNRVANDICVPRKILRDTKYTYIYSMWSKVLSHVKKIPIYSTKTIFFQKSIVKSFLDRFYQILHQNIQTCLYFYCLFSHYVYNTKLDHLNHLKIYEYCTILVYKYSCHILVLYKLENKMTMKMYIW
jgi:hypothetical protein